MMATLVSIGGCLLYIAYMIVLPCLVFETMSPTSPSFEDRIIGVSTAILLPLVLKNFPWFALISEFPFTFPSSVFEMVATLVGLAGYLVCMILLSLLVVLVAVWICDEAASHPVPQHQLPPSWMLMTGIGASTMVMDMFINHFIHSTMIAMLFFLAGYLVYIVCMTGLSYLVFCGAMSSFSVREGTDNETFVMLIAIFLPLAIKNFQWLAFIYEFPSTLPSSFFEMVATLVGLAGYLVCMMGLSFLVFMIPIRVLEAASHPVHDDDEFIRMIGLGTTTVVMDLFINHSIHSTMMSILFFVAGYTVYIVCMAGLPYLVFCGAMSSFSVRKNTDNEVLVFWIAIFFPLAIKNFQWIAFIYEFPSNFPSNVFQIVATLVGLAGYLVCMMGLSFLVFMIPIRVLEVASHQVHDDLMRMIGLGASAVVMDLFVNHSIHSTMMAILFYLAGYTVYIVCMAGLPYLVLKTISSTFPSFPVPFALPISIFPPLALKNFPWHAIIFEFPASTLPSSIFEMVATLVGLAGYLVCMTGLFFLGINIAFNIWEAASSLVPKKETPPDWMFMIGLGASSVLMDIFINHSSHSSMMAILYFLAGYLVYIVCMTGLPYLAFKATSNAFPSFSFHLISWIAIFLPLSLKNFPWHALTSEFHSTFTFSLSEMVATLAGLVGYLVCMTGMLFVVYFITNIVCQAASCPVPKKETPPDWMIVTVQGATVLVMDMFINHSSHSTTLAMLFLVAGYLVYVMLVTGLLYLILKAISSFHVQQQIRALLASITIFLSLALTQFQLLGLISEFPSSLPSNVSEIVAMILGVAELINNYHTAYMVISGLVVFVYIEITRNIGGVH